MSKELIFRILLSAGLIGVMLIGLRWIWTHQLDVKQTVSQLKEKTLSPLDWVATRDPNKIYQGGKPVGEVRGKVILTGVKAVFLQFVNTTGFDASLPFNYQRLSLKILHVKYRSGIKIEMTDRGSDTLSGVFEDIECDIIAK